MINDEQTSTKPRPDKVQRMTKWQPTKENQRTTKQRPNDYQKATKPQPNDNKQQPNHGKWQPNDHQTTIKRRPIEDHWWPNRDQKTTRWQPSNDQMMTKCWGPNHDWSTTKQRPNNNKTTTKWRPNNDQMMTKWRPNDDKQDDVQRTTKQWPMTTKWRPSDMAPLAQLPPVRIFGLFCHLILPFFVNPFFVSTRLSLCHGYYSVLFSAWFPFSQQTQQNFLLPKCYKSSLLVDPTVLLPSKMLNISIPTSSPNLRQASLHPSSPLWGAPPICSSMICCYTDKYSHSLVPLPLPLSPASLLITELPDTVALLTSLSLPLYPHSRGFHYPSFTQAPALRFVIHCSWLLSKCTLIFI